MQSELKEAVLDKSVIQTIRARSVILLRLI